MNKLIGDNRIVFLKYIPILFVIAQILVILIKRWNPAKVTIRSYGFNFMPLYIGRILYLYEYISMKRMASKVK